MDKIIYYCAGFCDTVIDKGQKYCERCKAQNKKDWEEDCLKWQGKILTGNNSHWCNSWDGLPIDETCDEYKCCECIIIQQDNTVVDNRKGK